MTKMIIKEFFTLL